MTEDTKRNFTKFSSEIACIGKTFNSYCQSCFCPLDDILRALKNQGSIAFFLCTKNQFFLFIYRISFYNKIGLFIKEKSICYKKSRSRMKKRKIYLNRMPSKSLFIQNFIDVGFSLIVHRDKTIQLSCLNGITISFHGLTFDMYSSGTFINVFLLSCLVLLKIIYSWNFHDYFIFPIYPKASGFRNRG